MKKSILAIGLACTTLLAGTAHAQFKSTNDAIEYRQAAFKLLGSHFGRMAPVVKGEAEFNADQIKANVAVVNTIAQLPWVAFSKGTEGGDAKPEVWSKPQEFDQSREKFLVAVKNLNEVADSGDLNKFKAAFADVGKSCRACHDGFRKKD